MGMSFILRIPEPPFLCDNPIITHMQIDFKENILYNKEKEVFHMQKKERI